MGGRGSSSSNKQSNSVIGKKKAIVVTDIGQQHREGTTLVGRATWSKAIYEAKPVAGENGVLEIGYAKKEYEQISRNKLKSTSKINAGIVSDKYGYQDHNINWNKVKEVRGKTYDIKDFIKKKGFSWNKDKKAWTK